MKAKYRPSFLVSTKVTNKSYDELNMIAVSESVPVEVIIRRAIKFYSRKCVHTHRRAARKRAASSSM